MKLSCLILCAMALSAASTALGAPPATAPTTAPANPRLITLKDFPDAGLATGPHTVWIYLPQDYAQSKESYRVIYFHDGHEVFFSAFPDAPADQTMRADVAYDQLIARNLIHPAILVAIDCGPKKDEGRFDELVPTTDPKTKKGGHIEGYFKFIATQVKPYVDRHYRTMPQPQYTGIAGFSFGGLASTYMGYYHSEVFGLAGCMSTSLWWNDQDLVKAIEADKSHKKPVRFWFDAGIDEGDSWQNSLRLVNALIAKGWREGDDVAFFLDYAGVHDHASWAYQVPQMLQYLLRKQEPDLSGVVLKQVTDPDGRAIRLVSATEQPYVTLELLYTGGLRLNAASPVLKSTNPQIATADGADFGRLQNHGRGVATITATYAGLTAAQTVIGYGPSDMPQYSRLACPKTAKPLPIDGTIADWKDIPFFALSDSPASASSPAARRFAVAHDDNFVYVAVEVTDPHVVFDPKKSPWDQDGVELRLDARPDPIRYNAGQGEGGQVTFLAASPSADNSGIYDGDKLPKGVKVTCKPTPTGYIFQAAIPSTSLETAQGGPWQDFRLNVCINDTDAVGTPVEKHWWQPDWRTTQNRPGSGTFRRQP